MKYTLHIIATNLKTPSKWFYRGGAFILNEVKRCKEFEPYYFDTIEAARSQAFQFLTKSDKFDYVYLCDLNGAQIERIERK
jgi:hypothetical protein